MCNSVNSNCFTITPMSTRFLLLISTPFLLLSAPNSFSKELIFVTKASTQFLKLLQIIFNYFSKIKFNESSQKDIFSVFIIFELDLINTMLGYPQNQLFAVKYFCKNFLNMPLNCQLSIFSNYND